MRFLASRSSRSSAFGPGAEPCDLLRFSTQSLTVLSLSPSSLATSVIGLPVEIT